MTAPAPLELDRIRRSLADRYTLERELGRGGMGTVYLARDIKLDRPVALKILLPEFATQAGLRDRFLRETRTAASFSHPNIVPVYAVEEADEHLAYAMGLVEGETLSQRVERTGPLPVRELVRIMQDVAYALAYAHGRGVVHRDIKPDNIMLERATGRALVMDFGISRSMAHAAPATATNLTRVGEVVGTPEYMSPEQASGDVVDGRSDLYALGLTAYFAASGRTAMTGESTQKILVRQLTERVPPISAARPDLPPALAAAIDRCVEKDPADRFATAEALVEEIDAAQLAEPEIPLPIRMFAGALSTLLFALLGITVLIWLTYRTQKSAGVTGVDVMLPIVGLVAILVTRVMTTMDEARRLAEAGFPADEIMHGVERVMTERVSRRAELRAHAGTLRRRRATIRWSATMLIVAIVMILSALLTRVRVGPASFQTPLYGIVLVFAGFAIFGMSMVLLLQSPFRTPPGERIFRLVWLGSIGRAFVWLSTRGVEGGAVKTIRTLGASATRPRVTAPRVTPLAILAQHPGAGAEPARQSRGALLEPTAISEPLAALEARVDALERWRNVRGE